MRIGKPDHGRARLRAAHAGLAVVAAARRSSAMATRCSWAWARRRSRASRLKALRMRTTAVELNPAVIAACRLWFHLPAPTARAAGAEHGRRRLGARPGASARRSRLAAVDLYDHEAAAPVLDDAAFYADCRGVLAEGGVMSVNLFGRDASFERSAWRSIAAAFGAGQVCSLQADARRQHVVLAGRGGGSAESRHELARRARITSRLATGCRRASGCAWRSRWPARTQPSMKASHCSARSAVTHEPTAASKAIPQRAREPNEPPPTARSARARSAGRGRSPEVTHAPLPRSTRSPRANAQAPRLARAAGLAARGRLDRRRRVRRTASALRRRRREPASAGAPGQRRPDARRRRQTLLDTEALTSGWRSAASCPTCASTR